MCDYNKASEEKVMPQGQTIGMKAMGSSPEPDYIRAVRANLNIKLQDKNSEVKEICEAIDSLLDPSVRKFIKLVHLGVL